MHAYCTTLHPLCLCAGDFVDRGSWGLEVLMLLGAWQLALPQSVTLLRGNHESATCTAAYGFQGELMAKYGCDAQRLYNAAERVFTSLPLAAHVAGVVPLPITAYSCHA